MKGWTLLAVALVLGLSTAGCIRDGSDRPTYRFPPLERGVGLGLDPGQPFPALGPFMEGESAKKVVDFLTLDAPAIALTHCPGTWLRSELVAAVEQRLKEPSPLRSGGVFAPYQEACHSRMPEKNPGNLASRPAGQSVREAYDRLLADTRGDVGKEAAGITAAIGRIGSISDAEFVAGVIDSHFWNLLMLQQQGLGFDAYKDTGDGAANPTTWTYKAGNPQPPRDDREPLATAASSLYSASLDARVNIRLLEAFPWADDACEAPDVGQLSEGILSVRNEALALARDHYDAKRDDFSDFPLERLEGFEGQDLGRRQEFTYVRDKGWWPALLQQKMEIEQLRTYWTIYEDAQPPTVDEAHFLVARFMNESRTLIQAPAVYEVWRSLQELEYPGYAEGNYGWGIRARASLEVLTMDQTPWAFGGLKCSPAEATMSPS